MGAMFPARSIALVVVLVLAGCAGPESKTVPAAPVQFKEATPTESTGAISGVVVDSEIVAIPNATVVITSLNRSVGADEAGSFVFEGLDPGLYNLEATAARFLAAQATADVLAGEVSKVRIVLPRDTRPQPFHETVRFAWFDSAGQPLVDFAWDLLRPEGAPALCDQCEWRFNSSGPVETFIIEAFWNDTTAPPDGPSEFYWTIEPTEDSSDYESDYFANPGYAVVDGNRWKNATEFFLMLSYDEDWVALDQRADVFVTLFYATAAPAGWSVLGES